MESVKVKLLIVIEKAILYDVLSLQFHLLIDFFLLVVVRCGEKEPKPIHVIDHGFETNITVVPWHVGIYSMINSDRICGGTILDERIVITAYDCFHDTNFDNYYVFIQQYQILNNSKLLLPKGRRFGIIGTSNYVERNIAILKLDSDIPFDEYHSSICVGEELWTPGSIGQTPGWKSNHDLEMIDVEFINQNECLIIDTQIIENDRFCVKYTKHRALNHEDNGSGLITDRIVDGRKRFFLHGIFNINYQMDNPKYITFRNTSFYAEQLEN